MLGSCPSRSLDSSSRNSASFNSLRSQLTECQKQASKELEATSHVMEHENYTRTRQKCRANDGLVDIWRVSHPAFGHFNPLQWAAVEGEVSLLEDAVALGAALDLPFLGTCTIYGDNLRYNNPAPQGATALLLACTRLAEAGINGMGYLEGSPEYLRLQKRLQRLLDCAILLVKLGANCNAIFRLGQGLLLGKTAKEMALLSGKTELIQAMAQMETMGKKIASVYCRCGSRLPWKECHAGKSAGEEAIYLTAEGSKTGGTSGERLHWSRSPLSPCHCRRVPKKDYYDCCWDSCNPSYTDDETGVRCVSASLPKGISELPNGSMVSTQIGTGDMLYVVDLDENGKTMVRAVSSNSVPNMDESMLKQLSTEPQSRLGEWDPNVYVGCVKRLELTFFWSDVHWKWEKSELLNRVEEWNEALEKYCDDH